VQVEKNGAKSHKKLEIWFIYIYIYAVILEHALVISYLSAFTL
jgi:hypothetical protein